MMIFCSVLIGTGIESAHSEAATFKLTNAAPYTIRVALFSQTRRWVWPSASRVWVLNDSRQHVLSARQCQPGEKICYGGSYRNRSGHWGVGIDGNRACQNCCIRCGQSLVLNLTSGSGPTVASRRSAEDHLVAAPTAPLRAQQGAGSNLSINETVNYIYNKYPALAVHKDRWFRIKYSNPYFKFEWQDVATGEIRSAVINLARVRSVTNPWAFTEIQGKNFTAHSIKFFCRASCIAWHESGANVNLDDAVIPIPIMGESDARYLAKAFAHLASLHGQTRDPFGD
jgi:hypothetical protein